MRHTTNCLLVRNLPHGEVLLGVKQRGFGEGKLVGVGGGIEKGETSAQAAARELKEEIGVMVLPEELEHRARIAFIFPLRPAWNHYVEVFTASTWRGTPAGGDELAPEWFPFEAIPFEKMWNDARHWVPLVLSGKRIFCIFTFAPDNQSVATMVIRPWDPSLPTYESLVTAMRAAYDANTPQRDTRPKTEWKLVERQNFMAKLTAAGASTLLEVGAGTGQDSLFFKENGLLVTCTDVSPENVRRCQAKGLDAHTADFLNLPFPDSSFDALYALNCLLHVPNPDLPRVLANLWRLLKPGGLFYLGVYGGVEWEGTWAGDVLEPKRFFVYRMDEDMQQVTRLFFEILYFRAIPVEGDEQGHFQSMILKKAA